MAATSRAPVASGDATPGLPRFIVGVLLVGGAIGIVLLCTVVMQLRALSEVQDNTAQLNRVLVGMSAQTRQLRGQLAQATAATKGIPGFIDSSGRALDTTSSQLPVLTDALGRFEQDSAPAFQALRAADLRGLSSGVNRLSASADGLDSLQVLPEMVDTLTRLRAQLASLPALDRTLASLGGHDGTLVVVDRRMGQLNATLTALQRQMGAIDSNLSRLADVLAPANPK